MDSPAPADSDQEFRARQVRLAKALAERRRRVDLNITLSPDGWRDATTNELLTDHDVMKREVAHERARPPTVDLQNKVIVDMQWLIETLGRPAFDEAMRDKRIRTIQHWL